MEAPRAYNTLCLVIVWRHPTEEQVGTFFEPKGEWLCKDCYAGAD